MTPDFKIIAAGVNITDQIRDRLLRLSVSDEAGLKADQVEITLDDRDNAIELPMPGALLAVFLGYKETALIPMGTYTADEVVVSGPPDTVMIRGRAANLGGTIKEQKSRSWEQKTIQQIVSTIAGEHRLEPKVSKAYRDYLYKHIDQTDESDINFLTRLSKEHDAIATVKGQSLLFIGRGEGRTASGLAMVPVPITKSGELRWRMTLTTRSNFKAVEATWHDQKTGRKVKIKEGVGAPVKKLRHTYPDEGDARAAARSLLAKSKRGNDTFSVSMPGNPLISAEGQIAALGFRAGVAGIWSITRARHEISGSGFTTSIEAEKPNSEVS